MGYMHIDNLYKNQEILIFKECYALEKLHGSSSNVRWDSEKGLGFFSGGEKHETFVKIFNHNNLVEKFEAMGVDKITVYGEVYGGRCQGMKDTYGDQLKFVAFDVKIEESWLDVPKAEQVVKDLGLEFVHYQRVSTDLKSLDAERDANSVQAIRNGMGPGKKREGVVLRPIIEVKKNNGSRIMAKHKRDDFRETKTPRKVIDPDKLKVLEEANEIAEEWVTPMRLNHILDKIPDPNIEKMGEIIKSMSADVQREGEGEIVWSKAVAKAVGKKTALMAKEFFKKNLYTNK